MIMKDQLRLMHLVILTAKICISIFKTTTTTTNQHRVIFPYNSYLKKNAELEQQKNTKRKYFLT